TENQQRGAGGDLNILQHQAPSHLSVHIATGDKDALAGSLVTEPLMHRLPDGSLIPNLVKEVPTVENGLLAQDLTSVTYNLLEGVTWSDGQPFTAQDVIFTWQWVMDAANTAVFQQIYTPIATIEAPDDLTAVIRFKAPNPTWFEAHTGSGGGVIYPRHVLEGGGQAANDAFRQKPLGTGPYVVESFSPNNQVVYAVNPNYREPTKPFFSRVVITGGGDAAAAARAVLQTGEYDFAWNLAVPPDVLRQMGAEDGPATLYVAPSDGIERININFSDPDTEVNGQRSEMNTPHPIFSDPAVRNAMAIAINREQIASEFFFGGDQEPAIANIVSGLPEFESPNTTLEFNPERANQLLDQAGWVRDGDVRAKDGVELDIRFATTISQVRQNIQAVVQRDLQAIGFRVTLEQIDGSVFFDSSPGNTQNNTHFYNDLNMFTSSVGAPPPVAYLVRWYAGPNGENIAQESNGWTGRNFQRYQNPDFDARYERLQTESNPEAIAQLVIEMNDILITNSVVIPLVRVGKKVAYSKRLREENLAIGSYEFDYWNIANWNLAEGA
ncbi:MAG: peptide ABC transporter substrate-binding protein, partial [Chloroflexota bacterium]|nr:peptide ABC transporter substrate-binding protein [Chloroflexota bacterium]